jgi:predicted DNA-binding transcriptional regulator YafY
VRAGRLIAILFALQDGGRMTAGRLAERLEVSERTVLRDVAELSQAGVPVYAVPGAGGGIELLDGFRGGLTGMTRDEAAALPVAGQPRLAAALGLAVAAQSARGTVLRALPPALGEAAAELDSWFLHDPLGRDVDREQAARLRQVVGAVRGRVELQIDPDPAAAAAGAGPAAGSCVQPLRPLGLVLEAGRWLLVHLAHGPDGPRPALLALPVPLGRCTLGGPFERPALDLAAWWAGMQTNPPEGG